MLLGPERALYAFYDEPALVDDMMETITDFSIAVLAPALREAPVTYVQFWEDMAYKTGPLISPAMVRRFMLPRYRRIVETIRAAGVDQIIVDSDGDVSELIPIWLEAGINGVQPLEQAAGNDLRAYRREYGRDLAMTGGIDKRALARGREAIDRELVEKVPLALEGGYIPTIDHAVPPDASWDNWRYYWNRKKEMLGVG
jgi:uroporphyrinogen decarboxylase